MRRRQELHGLGLCQAVVKCSSPVAAGVWWEREQSARTHVGNAVIITSGRSPSFDASPPYFDALLPYFEAL